MDPMSNGRRGAPRTDHGIRIALVTSTALAVCFAALYGFALVELRVANARLARAEDVRGFAIGALGAAQRAELADLRSRRASGMLPPRVGRGGGR